MAYHADLKLATGLPVYFCDPSSPWQRGSNENTNGLLRQYFPRGTDLSRYELEELNAVAKTLNSRPRKTLGWENAGRGLPRTARTHYNKHTLRRPIESTQYASGEYVERLQEAGVLISMAAVGNPYENAKAESFFRTLKVEEVYLKDYRDFEEAEGNIGQFIEEVYNQKRLHSSLGYLPPVEFEAQHALKVRS